MRKEKHFVRASNSMADMVAYMRRGGSVGLIGEAASVLDTTNFLRLELVELTVCNDGNKLD